MASSQLRWRDLWSQAASSLRGRRSRSALTALGTVIGIAAFVTISGFASTARAQVSNRFDVLRATEVFVTLNPDAVAGATPLTFPNDTDARLGRLHGVRAAGVLWPVSNPNPNVSTQPVISPSSGAPEIPVFAASPGALEALRPVVSAGRLFNGFHNDDRERVVVLGRSSAEQLHITDLENQPTVFLGATGYTVIGIIADVARRADVLNAVIIPQRTALSRYPNSTQDQEGVIEVAPGAAALVGRQAAIAIDVLHPDRYRTEVPPDPRTLREHVVGDVQKLFFGLGLIALVMGMVAIANSTLVAVMERTGEIGLRRAMGARRTHIARQVVAESALIGGIGGAIGTSLGVLGVSGIAIAQGWTAVISPPLVLAAPLVGIATGTLAGIYPALRAARIEPVEALRSA